MKFEEAIEVILRHEGGYVNHPSDPGGETNFGITKRSYPDLDIRKLTRDEAIEIYRRDFWERNDMDSIPAQIRLQLFDMSVNAGARNAAKILQTALVKMGYNIAVDGAIGPRTKDVLKVASPHNLASMYTLYRIAYYSNLVAGKSTLATFLKGWIRRALQVGGIV